MAPSSNQAEEYTKRQRSDTAVGESGSRSDEPAEREW